MLITYHIRRLQLFKSNFHTYREKLRLKEENGERAERL